MIVHSAHSLMPLTSPRAVKGHLMLAMGFCPCSAVASEQVFTPLAGLTEMAFKQAPVLHPARGRTAAAQERVGRQRMVMALKEGMVDTMKSEVV